MMIPFKQIDLFIDFNISKSDSKSDSELDSKSDSELDLSLTRCFDIIHSCRGFLLLHLGSGDIILYNPVNHSQQRISFPQDYDFFSILGCGFDASKDDFVAVATWFLDDKEKLGLYSFRKDTWYIRDGNFAPFHGCIFDEFSQTSPFFNGAIHWLVSDSSAQYFILVFDVIEMAFSKINIPEGAAEMIEISRGSLPRFMITEGYLAVSLLYDEARLFTWIMKEYRVQSSWALLPIIESKIQPIYITKGCDIIALAYNPCDADIELELLKYNDEGNLLQRRSSRIWPVIFTESIVSLPTRDVVTKKKKMKKRRMKKLKIKRKKIMMFFKFYRFKFLTSLMR